MCGATNYALSYGGPDICPACDTYGFCPRCKSLKAENERLKDILTAHNWSESIKDKPKEYCKPFKERYGIEIDGKWTPLSELPHEVEELNKLTKPKTEKIERGRSMTEIVNRLIEEVNEAKLNEKKCSAS